MTALTESIADAIAAEVVKWRLADDDGPLGPTAERNLADDCARAAVLRVREALAQVTE